MRRGIVAGLVLVLAVGELGMADAGSWLPGKEPGTSDKAARRRWALARMDEMANERLRCRGRFTRRREVEACEADYTRRFRQYNEIYLEAARE